MEYARDVSSDSTPWIKPCAVLTGTKGAALMRGVTTDVDLGVGIIAASGAADVIGVLSGDPGTFGVYATGTIFNNSFLKDVVANSDALFYAEYDQTDTMTATSSSGTTVAVGSLEANISGGWLYVVGGTGAGQLQYIVTSTGGSCTTLTAFNPVLDGTSTLIKILPPNHLVAKLNSAATGIGTDAAAGTGAIAIVDNFIQTRVDSRQRLQPGVHSGRTSLNASGMNTKFYALIQFRDHILNPLS